ncbi:MAG: roadblock/LC7 domain-containing protein [Desulfuromonadales bacterium]|nr:roadblock/LC7 domain-containing protein [Desulfuromonadales bacterium]
MFDVILERIVNQCPGGLGALIMGFDGIGIEEYVVATADLDLTLVGIEYSHVIKEIRHASEILKVGSLHEVSIKTEQFYVIIQTLTDEYFVALVIDRTGNFGKGRYLLLRESFELKQMLS